AQAPWHQAALGGTAADGRGGRAGPHPGGGGGVAADGADAGGGLVAAAVARLAAGQGPRGWLRWRRASALSPQYRSHAMGRLFAVAALLCLLALPALAADKDAPKEVQVQGTLKTGIVAIGGETTGTIIKTKTGTFELDLGKNKELRALVKKLDGKEVVVSGPLQVRKGVEVKERRIITVKTLKAAGDK